MAFRKCFLFCFGENKVGDTFFGMPNVPEALTQVPRLISAILVETVAILNSLPPVIAAKGLLNMCKPCTLNQFSLVHKYSEKSYKCILVYCMKVVRFKVPEVWYCEMCLPKAHIVHQGKMLYRRDKNKQVDALSGGVEHCAAPCKSSASNENVSPLTFLINPNGKFPSSPIPEACWRGSFEVFDIVNHVYSEIQARFPSQVSHKVYEISKNLPAKLKFNMLPRRDAWPKIFQFDPPAYGDIGLYFCPSLLERPREKYFRLLERIESRDCVMKTLVEDVELLIYPSKQLKEDCHRIDRETYLWGVFRHAKRRKKQQSRTDMISSPIIELKSSNPCDQLRVVLEDNDHEVGMENCMIDGREIGGVDIRIGKEDAHRTFTMPSSILHSVSPITTELDVPPGFSRMSKANGRRVSPIPKQKTLGTLCRPPHASAAALPLFPSEAEFMKINNIGDDETRQNISTDLSLSRPNYLIDGNVCLDMAQKPSFDIDEFEEDLQLKL
ncbi:hypothetical protein Cni_G23234 [Canna indica]|uniref:AIPP2-like SPOC-like domain-containing protein n=1 Tax=Canna indica TaxID=4628 RepID=A0AAQ3KTD9_9LILI|nr:hypothetical protein Cni_G23234 [Canna indica]